MPDTIDALRHSTAPAGDAPLSVHLDRLRGLLENLNVARDARTRERIIDELRPAIVSVRRSREQRLAAARSQDHH